MIDSLFYQNLLNLARYLTAVQNVFCTLPPTTNNKRKNTEDRKTHRAQVSLSRCHRSNKRTACSFLLNWLFSFLPFKFYTFTSNLCAHTFTYVWFQKKCLSLLNEINWQPRNIAGPEPLNLGKVHAVVLRAHLML